MLRLVSDEDMDGKVINGLRHQDPALDLVRVSDVGLGATPDPIILEWAAKEGRVVLTRDRNSMVGFAYDRVLAGLPMQGVIVVKERMKISDAVEQVMIVACCHTPEEMKDRVIFLPLR